MKLDKKEYELYLKLKAKYEVCPTRYVVRRARVKSDALYGSCHGSHDGDNTLCGEVVDIHWWITHTNNDGIITCSKCLKILEKKE